MLPQGRNYQEGGERPRTSAPRLPRPTLKPSEGAATAGTSALDSGFRTWRQYTGLSHSQCSLCHGSPRKLMCPLGPCWALMHACLLAQPCPTLCDPMDCNPAGSSVLAILQARILEWVAMTSSRVFPTQGSNLHLSRLLRWRVGSLPSVLLLLLLFNVWLKCFLFWELSLTSLPSPLWLD